MTYALAPDAHPQIDWSALADRYLVFSTGPRAHVTPHPCAATAGSPVRLSPQDNGPVESP